MLPIFNFCPPTVVIHPSIRLPSFPDMVCQCLSCRRSEDIADSVVAISRAEAADRAVVSGRLSSSTARRSSVSLWLDRRGPGRLGSLSARLKSTCSDCDPPPAYAKASPRHSGHMRRDRLGYVHTTSECRVKHVAALKGGRSVPLTLTISLYEIA